MWWRLGGLSTSLMNTSARNRPTRRFLALASALFLSLSVSVSAQSTEATYEVTFDADWSSTTHPSAFPGGAHFSRLIGGTHGDAYQMWAPGGFASPGMESMAETGAITTLRNEVLAAITAGTAGEVVTGPAIGTSPGQAVTSFTITSDHPRISLTTMIAPSPDWFVGVHGVALLDSGAWVDDLVVDLYAYDAGTDSGANFSSPNQNTSPQDPIQLQTGGPFFGTVPLGTFTFRRVASTLRYGSGINPAGSIEYVGATPAVGQTLSFLLHDPSGTMVVPATTFLAVSVFPDASFPAGTVLPNFGLSAPGADGELLVALPLFDVAVGAIWTGSPAPVDFPVPNDPALVGVNAYFQGVLRDANGRFGLTNGIEVRVGP